MARAAGRSQEETKQWLLAAAVSVLEDHYTNARERGERDPVPITVTEVLDRVPEVSGGTRLSPGAVAYTFGDKGKFLSEVAASFISADAIIGDLGSLVAELRVRYQRRGPELRRELLQADFANTTRSIATTRHWFASHAEAADPAVRAQLDRVYHAFDSLLVGLYAEIGEWEGRVPHEGLSWSDVAAALTALTEGAALRRHLDPTDSEIAWLPREDHVGLAVLAGDGVWEGCTTPVAHR